MKRPQQGSGRWRNVIAIGAIAAVTGFFGFGVGIQYEQKPANLNSANRVESNIVAPLMIHEVTPGALAAGTGTVDVITGVTKDGSLLIQSGALVMGADGAAKITLSGSNVMAKGNLSGASLNVTGLAGAAIGQAACIKAGKQLGYCSTTPTNGTCTCN